MLKLTRKIIYCIEEESWGVFGSWNLKRVLVSFLDRGVGSDSRGIHVINCLLMGFNISSIGRSEIAVLMDIALTNC